jgi:hypothetical protein
MLSDVSDVMDERKEEKMKDLDFFLWLSRKDFVCQSPIYHIFSSLLRF